MYEMTLISQENYYLLSFSLMNFKLQTRYVIYFYTFRIK